MMPTPTPSEDPTEMPTCYPPNAELLESMGDLLSRGPSEARFPKIGRRLVVSCKMQRTRDCAKKLIKATKHQKSIQ